MVKADKLNENSTDFGFQPFKLQMETSQVEFRIKNSHCSYFGIYSFNLTKWRSLEPSEIRTWCNSTKAKTAYDLHRNEWIAASSLSNSNAADKYDKMYDTAARKLKIGHHRKYLVGYLKVLTIKKF